MARNEEILNFNLCPIFFPLLFLKKKKKKKKKRKKERGWLLATPLGEGVACEPL